MFSSILDSILFFLLSIGLLSTITLGNSTTINERNAQFDQGEALPIVVPNKEAHSFSLNSRLLQQVLLNPRVADKKVALVAVAGEFRKGKSFLLNFFLRYLAHHSDDSYEGNWLNPTFPLASQFSFKRSTQTHTKGILLWSEPFLTRNPHTGDELAILLMDTQGSFDDESSLQENAIIFSLSTMVSSTLIYNIGGQIKSSDLQYLQFFAKYAELALESRNDAAETDNPLQPFQSLLFLVRDWANPQEMDFGFQGGQQLLDQHLTVRENDTPEMRKLRGDIRDKLFQSVLCFLMPYPGKMVAGHGKATFAGNLTDIDEEFMDQINILVPALFENEKLNAKLINGQPVTGRELNIYFKTYFAVFNSKKMPDVKNVLEATAEANHQVAKAHALELYTKLMEEQMQHSEAWNETELLELSHECENISIGHFLEAKKLGDSKLTGQYLLALREQIQQIYKQLAMVNRLKAVKFEAEQKERALKAEMAKIRGEIEVLRNDSEANKEQIAKMTEEFELTKNETAKAMAEAERSKRELENAQAELEREKGGFWTNLANGIGGFIVGTLKKIALDSLLQSAFLTNWIG